MITDDRDGQDNLTSVSDDVSAVNSADTTQTPSSVTSPTKAKAWIANDADALPGYGKIMLSRPSAEDADKNLRLILPDGLSGQSQLDGALANDDPRLIRNLFSSLGRASNDNAIWVGDDDGVGGVYGRDATAVTLDNGDSVVAWIGQDNIVHAKIYPPLDAGLAALVGQSEAHADINALLADLGTSSAGATASASRLKLITTPGNGFAAVWTAEFALTSIIMGKAFACPAALSAGDDDSGLAPGWLAHDIAPVSVPRFAGAFTVQPKDAHRLEISYSAHDGDGTSVHDVVIDVATGEIGTDVLIGTQADDTLALPPSTLADTEPAYSAHLGHANEQLPLVDAHAPTEAAPIQDLSNVDAELLPVTFADFAVAGNANDTIIQNRPQIVVTDNKTVYEVHLEAGVKPGSAKIIASTIDTKLGTVSNSVTVTENALADDPVNGALDLTPAVEAVGEDLGVAWVEINTSGDHPVKQLVLEVLDETGSVVGGGPVVVAVAETPDATFSGIDLGYAHRGHQDHREHGEQSQPGAGDQPASQSASNEGGTDATPPAADQPDVVAVVWVQNAGEDGVGKITAQLFTVPDNSGADDGSGGGLVAIDGNGDADGTRCDLSDNGGDIIGRAPQVEGLSDGNLAVAWVKESAPGSGIEVIQAVVIDPAAHTLLQTIDLSNLMPGGIAAGTDPILIDTPDGNIVINWLQAALLGGFEAAAAIVRHAANGGWITPLQATILNHFDELPSDFTLTAHAVTSDGESQLSLVMTWRDDDNNVMAASCNVDQQHTSQPIEVHHNDAGNSGPGSGGTDAVGLSIADLGDGTMLVMYANADGNDVDVRAQLIDFTPVDNSGSGSGAGISSSASGTDISSSASGTDNSSSGSGTDNSGSASGTDNSGPGSGPGCISGGDGAGTHASDNSGPGSDSSGNSGPGGGDGQFNLIQIDLNADTITITTVDGSNAGSASEQGSTQSASSGPSGPSASDITATLAAFSDHSDTASGTGLASNGTCGGSSGQGSSGDHDSGPAAMADNDNLVFFAGFGNDAEDFVVPDADHDSDAPDAVAALFDDLQFANALNQLANDDVLTFDADNVVSIQKFSLIDKGHTPFDV